MMYWIARQPDYYFSGCRDDSYIFKSDNRIWLDKSVNFERRTQTNKSELASKRKMMEIQNK